jgi:hypothetical protein
MRNSRPLHDIVSQELSQSVIVIAILRGIGNYEKEEDKSGRTREGSQ